MITFILLILVTTIWIWGIKCLFSTGHLLEKAGDWVEERLPEWVYKPTIGCPACMSSVHGTLWFWIVARLFLNKEVIPIQGYEIILWIIFCICLCGVNFILLESIYKEE